MPKIAVSAILGDFQRMLDEHWKYTAGAAETGNVDCSGAFVWSYRQRGQHIYHGSNRIARTEIVELLPISAAEPGMAAFKTREPSDSRYALPSGYKFGGKYYNGDLRDFYHIGLVGEDGNVLNAQSSATGFVSSPIKTWSCVARLKKIDYGDDEKMPENTEVLYAGTVFADSGSTVNLRKSASKSSAPIERVKIGATVNVLEDAGEWLKVETETHQGYMMARFVRREDACSTSGIEARLSSLEARVAALEGGVG